jgi:hypothetical protein
MKGTQFCGTKSEENFVLVLFIQWRKRTDEISRSSWNRPMRTDQDTLCSRWQDEVGNQLLAC